MDKYRIVVESGCDLPQWIADQYHIYVAPMHVSFGDVTKDDVSFPIEELYGYYKKEGQLPKTSGCTVIDFKNAFDTVHTESPESHIIFLAYSAVTTCGFQSAHIAAEGRDYVTCIDTKHVSAGQTMVVLAVARFIEANPDATIEEITVFAEDIRDKVHMGFFPGDLIYLKAGGRVSNAAYLGAKLLSLNPLIEVNNGYLEATKKYRGSMKKVAKKFVPDYTSLYRMDKNCISVVFSAGLDEQIKQDAINDLKALGYKEVILVQTGSVVSTHAGPGGFGIIGYETN